MSTSPKRKSGTNKNVTTTIPMSQETAQDRLRQATGTHANTAFRSARADQSSGSGGSGRRVSEIITGLNNLSLEEAKNYLQETPMVVDSAPPQHQNRTMTQIVDMAISREQERIATLAKTTADEKMKAALVEVFNISKDLRKETCSLCEMYGHSDSYCWLNGSMYDLCRRRGKGPQYSAYRRLVTFGK